MSRLFCRFLGKSPGWGSVSAEGVREEPTGLLGHHAGESEDRDEVGDGHKAVEGIAEVPGQIQLHGCTDNGEKDKDDFIENRGLGAEEIFKCLGAVVAPAQHRGEGKKQNGNGNKGAAEAAEMETEGLSHHGGFLHRGQNRTGIQVHEAAGEDHQGGQGAHHQGVGKHLKNAPHSLGHRLFHIGAGMDHDAGAETCFIGKHAPLHAPGHSRLYPAANNAAADGLHGKGTLEDGSESRQDAPVIHSNDGQCSNDIQQRHNRYQLFRDCRNALQASHDDQSCNGHQKHTRDPVWNGENRPHVGGNGIDLSHIAHAKLHTIDPNDPEQTNRPDSRTREVQAESVAYAVCQHYGLDTSEYSFGYVAGWSSGRELAELKASLEIIRSAAHELIAALDEHLAELRQQREADLSAAQEAAFALDNGNTLFIQTCDSGYDYTLYGPDHTALDGGQLDAPGLTLPDAGQEALNLLGQTAAVSEVLLGDKLAAFQEAAEKANEIPTPIKIPDPAAEPTVTILWSESDKLQDGEIMPLSVANRVFEELDTAQHTDREKDGYEGGWYDKTAFRIDFTLNGQPDNYEGRQDFGDGDGSLIQHILSYHEYYAKDENWKNFVLHNKGPEAWEQDKAEREMVLTEFIPYAIKLRIL